MDRSRSVQKEVEVQSKKDRANQLNAWCVKFLGEMEWGKLKTFIRKRRERKNRALRSVSISEKAFELIKKAG